MNDGFIEIAGYEGLYSISESGALFSIRKNQLLSVQLNKRGYLQVDLYRNGLRKKHYVHRLVAKTFIPNPDNLPEVNHEDGVKANCHRLNLTWSTHADNMLHATKSGLISSASGLHGVFLTKKSRKTWKVELVVAGVLTYLGSYPDPFVAAKVYNDYVIANGLPNVLNDLILAGG